MADTKLHTYQIALPDFMRIDGTNLEAFFMSGDNEVDIQLSGRD